MLQGIKKGVCWREAQGRRGGCIVSLLTWERAKKGTEVKWCLNRREESTKGTEQGVVTGLCGMLWCCTRSWLAQSSYTFDVNAITSQLQLFVKWELKWSWCLTRDKTDCKHMSWGLLWVLSVKIRWLEYGGKHWKSQRRLTAWTWCKQQKCFLCVLGDRTSCSLCKGIELNQRIPKCMIKVLS